MGKQGGTLHAVGTLVTGTVAAQAIGVLVLPITTRLYSPTDFSVLATYVAILAIASSAACLRLELAIPLPECDGDAANLLILALLASLTFSAMLMLVILCVPAHWLARGTGDAFLPYLWLIPAGVWLASSYAALQYWSTRQRKFPLIARTRMAQAVGSAATQIGLGYFGLGSIGLLLGHAINSGAGVVRLAHTAILECRSLFCTARVHDMRRVLRQYKAFPQYATVEVIFNNIGVHLPVILISTFLVGPAAGFVLIALRTIAIPMSVIGSAVAQVYIARAPEQHRNGRLGVFTGQAIGRLIRLGVGPLLFAGVTAPVFLPIILGEAWAPAGKYIAWMTPWFIVQFITSPVSMTLDVTGNQRTALIIQVAGAVLRVGVVLLAWAMHPGWIIQAYAISGLIFYIAYFVVVVHVADVSLPALRVELVRSVRGVLLWLLLAVTVRALSSLFLLWV